MTHSRLDLLAVGLHLPVGLQQVVERRPDLLQVEHPLQARRHQTTGLSEEVLWPVP